VQRRFGERAAVHYRDTGDPEVRAQHEQTVMRISEDGLLYPVTVIDGEPVYDGAVSHAVILRAIQTKLEAVTAD
jgi:disulfide oxidoreductase YuzD